ncbi:MAG: hypothetical protein IJO43_00865 [Bacilli bacterium]|nr:hypothetical protein [Bacilli bacterium]
MKKCYKCNVSINTNVDKCPLCDNALTGKKEGDNIFPIIPSIYTKNTIFLKLLLFASILGCVICSIINLLVSGEVGWAWFVIAGIVSFWITFMTGIKKRNHFMKLLFSEVMVVLVSSVLWDYFTGWHLWSVTYVLPFLCIAYITALFFLRFFIKNIFKDYVIYIYINALIGLIPLYFILRGTLSNEWPSVFCVLFSVCVILALAVFNHRQMKNEIERRLHI